ncbi:flagellar filament capping protein FliD [Luteimonas kalidii]|uniref:Flagellar hook-associated protein 2 n=1 Tax=Luteimonas kalidii TaxID=3042025 RepID=A0ABT6JWT8_9GAMM|nr:flagellar filament capping protein FliD [Luteimonas kalidii]MDH5834958.1 flagellar filament capping protein FliD [Luteimonas kalidii]
MSTTIGTAGKLDVPTMVAQLVAADRAQADARIDRSERQVNAQVSAIGALRSAFSTLGTAVNALTSSDNLQARKAILPPEANFSATTQAGAAAGRYQIEVLALASAQKLTSGAFAADAAVGTGTLTISAGETSIEVEITAPDNTLADIRDAINAKAGGKTVTASIVTGDDGPHLVLNAVDTGSAGALTVAASGGDGGLSALAYDPEGVSGLTQLLPAADAKVRIDGIERTSASNTLDAIDNVSLTLTKAEPGTVRELRIEGDASLQRSAAKSFVSAYNAALGAIAQTTAYNTGTRVAAALNGDAMVRNATRELRDVIGDNVTDLKAIGITINKDGTLKLDEAAFDKGLAATPEAAARVFSGGDGMVGRLDAVVDRLVESDGLLESRNDSLAERSKTLANQRSALDFRMSQAEARYRTQFTALDVLLSSLQTSSDFLTQQLARPSTD